jgi:hypothetical protein
MSSSSVTAAHYMADIKFVSPTQQREARNKQFKKKCQKNKLDVVDYTGPLVYRGPVVMCADFSLVDKVRQAVAPLETVYEQDRNGTWMVHPM